MHSTCTSDVLRVKCYPIVGYAPPAILAKLGRSRTSATILVVAGDPIFRHCLKSSLQEAGFVVHIAPNGQEALTILAKVAIDLVMMDAKLIETTDFILCSALRTAREVPIIVIATSRSPEDIIAAFVAGADDCVAKPFSFSEVTACIKKQLSGPNLS